MQKDSRIHEINFSPPYLGSAKSWLEEMREDEWDQITDWYFWGLHVTCDSCFFSNAYIFITSLRMIIIFLWQIDITKKHSDKIKQSRKFVGGVGELLLMIRYIRANNLNGNRKVVGWRVWKELRCTIDAEINRGYVCKSDFKVKRRMR
jgi:hypothetical protein